MCIKFLGKIEPKTTKIIAAKFTKVITNYLVHIVCVLNEEITMAENLPKKLKLELMAWVLVSLLPNIFLEHSMVNNNRTESSVNL